MQKEKCHIGGLRPGAVGAEQRGAGVPGKQTLVERSYRSAGAAVQLRSQPGLAGRDAAGDDDARRVHASAERGLRGSSTPLPHLERIQRLFGRHDVTSVRAHVGGPAEAASREMGAAAYATGTSVAFARKPDLHTAAHEAAHVVQQRGGVQLKNKIGEAGDAYERHADEVADQVVRGQSAESLLDRMAGAQGGAAPATSAAIQRQEAPPFDASAAAAEIEKLVRPGHDEAQALKKLDELDMAHLLAVVEKLYDDADANNPDEGGRWAYADLSHALRGTTSGVNVARLRAAFDAAPNRKQRNPVEKDPGTNPTLSGARKVPSGVARPGDWGEDPEGNTWIMHSDGIRTYFGKNIAHDRRSSAWLANNPGNADYVKSITKRAVGSFHWGKGVHDFAVYFSVDDASADLCERMGQFATVGAYIKAHLGNNSKDNNNFDTYMSNMQSVVPELSTSDPTSKWTAESSWKRILNGFKAAEGWSGSTEGHTLTAAKLSAAPSDPKQAAVVQYYRGLLGVPSTSP